jgi:pimeloyl-ACP methyl ester carboxylesterase
MRSQPFQRWREATFPTKASLEGSRPAGRARPTRATARNLTAANLREEFAGLRRHSETAMIPGAGHLPQMEDPEPVRRAVLGFLDRSEKDLPDA